jgi:outer membrane cobalamin receptor
VSSAFNLPPLGYLYDPFSGNPQLQPETARSGELGLQWAEGPQVMRATLFSTQTDNLMLYDFNTFRFENVTKATNKGLEVSFNGKLSAADVRASLTAQDPVDDSTGAWLPRRARQMASVGINLPWGAWLFGANVAYTGKRPDTAHRLPDRGNDRVALPAGRRSAHRRHQRLHRAAAPRARRKAQGQRLHQRQDRQDSGARPTACSAFPTCRPTLPPR